MSDLTKHTLTINISDRIEWIDKRCGLTEIQKDYISAQMKEVVDDAVQQANGANARDSHFKNILNDLLNSQQEVISSPVRFNGVSIEDIKRVFKSHGVKYKSPF